MFSTRPTMRPPTTAPGMESSPPRITTGKTLKPTRERFTSTPMMFPQMMPPRADTMPVIAHASPKYFSTLMPIAMATCWLSATARIAIPLRDFTKNQPNPARNNRLTRPPTSWIGGMNSGPMMKGSSGMGRGSGRDPAPNAVGPIPRRMEARPMVAMTTAMTGRPISLRSITRSRPKPKAIMVPMPSPTASQSGAPQTPSAAATRIPAIITNSPWAKFTASVALYTRTKPRAMSAYISPMRIPLDIRSRKNPNSSDTAARSFHVLDVDAGLDGGLPAILVSDGGGQLDRLLASVQRIDHGSVPLGHESPAHLAGARHLRVVRLEVLRQQEEATELRGVGQGLVSRADLLPDQVSHLRLLGQIHVRGVREAATLGPVPYRAEVDGDHGGDERPVVSEGHRLPDVRAELQLVLDELRREGRPVGEGAHVLGAVDDDQVSTRVDEARIPGVKPSFGIDDFAGRFLVLQVSLEHRAPPHEDLTALADPDLHPGHRAPGGRGIRLGVELVRPEPGGLGGAIDLLQVDSDGTEESEGVGAERRATGQRKLGPPEAELGPDGTVHEELAERGGQTQGGRHRLAFGPKDLRALGRRAEILEGPALQRCRVGGPHLDRGQHVLPDPGRGQERRRAQLPQIPLHRLGALGTVGAEADREAGEQRVDGVAGPRHWQVGERGVLGGDSRLLREGLGHPDGVGVADHGALGAAGGARGIADEGHVVRLALRDLGLEVVRPLGGKSTPRLLHGLVRLEPVVPVPAQAPGVVVHHEAQGRQLGAQAENLVDLLLILGDDDTHLGVAPDVGELLGDRVLVHRDGSPAQALRRHLRPVESGPVVPDDGQAVAPPEPEGGQTERELAHLVVVLAPGPRLPDPAVLLADRGAGPEIPRVPLKQARQRHRLSHVGLHSPRSARACSWIRSARLRLRLAHPSWIRSARLRLRLAHLSHRPGRP